jgi:hypothetical protein
VCGPLFRPNVRAHIHERLLTVSETASLLRAFVEALESVTRAGDVSRDPCTFCKMHAPNGYSILMTDDIYLMRQIMCGSSLRFVRRAHEYMWAQDVGIFGIAGDTQLGITLQGYGVHINYATPPRGPMVCDAISGAAGERRRNADAFELAAIADPSTYNVVRDGRAYWIGERTAIRLQPRHMFLLCDGIPSSGMQGGSG